jgi:hypothetical protein
MIVAAIVVTLIAVIAGGIVLALVAWKRKKAGELEEPDYRAFFIMGIVCVPVGIVFMLIVFQTDIPFVVAMPLFAMGLMYLAIGLANRDKWKKRR